VNDLEEAGLTEQSVGDRSVVKVCKVGIEPFTGQAENLQLTAMAIVTII